MDTAAAPAAEGRTTLYHRRHAWQQRAKTLGHVGPALVLLFAVQPVLAGEEAFTPLVVLEFAVGAAYLVLMVRELLHLRHNPFHQERVAWLELASAAILAIESYHIWHRHHAAHLARGVHRLHMLPWIYAALAVVYVVLAFRMKQMAGRRFLHLRPEGFAARTKPLGRAHELRWADLAAAEPAGPADVLLHRHDGQTHRISFADLHDGPAHRDRLLAHAAQALAPAPEGA
ncbi:hypothetical protein KB206_18765 [Microvirga sp. STS02]|uniref:hypothetical protein n=1 Tax=Hymenobacter negativus TaxID=2795026 RepID=UPI0018DDF806|nr:MULTISPECIES: hypothetical protein [Bacteria]MBH8570941.1 hypothetical protein [Hymenobacter negativus]MBR7210679.1 hypothetical protein [Microvirga sp. STS02]